MRNPAQIAASLKVARTTVTRVMAEEILPGNAFIASALTAFPHLRFEDLFELTT
ncbi:MAG: hypothetical protein M3443_11590 [Actinomycetota bacterium]|nr:hypothetical protein [Actinomycetota bacterium]